jgi:chromate transporter
VIRNRSSDESNVASGSPKLSALQVLAVFLTLGLTSFGGPVAHLGYFHEEFVIRRKCLSEHDYADLVALCQFLPGPASSQVGIGIGISQAGIRGSLAAWTGFTLPSAAALILFAYGVTAWRGAVTQTGWLHGLKVVAAAVVAQAIWGMAKTMCPDRLRGMAAILAAALMLAWSGSWGQIVVILLGGLFGLLFLKTNTAPDRTTLHIPIRRGTAIISIVLFGMLIIGIPALASLVPNHTIDLLDRFYRTGSLVFGGGHVVLPLLETAAVSPGWVSKDLFLVGYGAAQAVPGPLFTFSAYLGAVMQPEPTGWLGGLICLCAIFLPSFLLLLGILPFWEKLRQINAVRSALMGVNAVVVGLLLAVFYDTVWASSILSSKDFILGLIAFGLLSLWKIPPWLVVLLTALGSAATAAT